LAQEYKDAKESLRKNPGDSRLKEAVLKAGRKYYENSGYSPQEREEMLRNDLYVIIGCNR